MKRLQYVVWFVVAVTAGLVLAGQLGMLQGTPPPLGVHDGRLKPPSLTPNSVSSQAMLYPEHPQRDYAAIAPLTYQGDGVLAMQRLAELLLQTERTVLAERTDTYLYAQCSTAVLRFTDDMEFWLDAPNGVIQVRSASRLGRRDLGVNRQRVEAIRAAFKRRWPS